MSKLNFFRRLGNTPQPFSPVTIAKHSRIRDAVMQDKKRFAMQKWESDPIFRVEDAPEGRYTARALGRIYLHRGRYSARATPECARGCALSP